MARKKNKKLAIHPEWCKGCSICVAFCPESVLALDENCKITIVNEATCTECRLCELRCPDFAVELVDLEEDVQEVKP